MFNPTQIHAFGKPNLLSMTLHQTMIVRLRDLSGAHAPLVVYLCGSDSATLRAQGARLAPVLYAAWPVRRPLSDPDQRTGFLA